MLKSFLALDLPVEASDQMIRQRYLELVKRFPPEKAPEKFRSITAAYETVKDKRTRVQRGIFSALTSMDYEEDLRTLADAALFKKKRTTLEQIVETSKGGKQ
ncbi:MAG: J domain-containing protein [Desulfobacteraceae bacterium]